MRRWRALGARTGRALRHSFTQSDCMPFDVPLAWGLRGRGSFGRCHWQEGAPGGPSPLEKHLLYPSAPSPKAPRHWNNNGLALGCGVSSAAVRASCAHPRMSIGPAIGKALRTNRALPHRLVKGVIFKQFFHTHWLAKEVLFNHPFRALARGLWPVIPGNIPVTKNLRFPLRDSAEYGRLAHS